MHDSQHLKAKPKRRPISLREQNASSPSIYSTATTCSKDKPLNFTLVDIDLLKQLNLAIGNAEMFLSFFVPLWHLPTTKMCYLLIVDDKILRGFTSPGNGHPFRPARKFQSWFYSNSSPLISSARKNAFMKQLTETGMDQGQLERHNNRTSSAILQVEIIF